MADSTAVDAAATTSAEAAQYRAAGWWSDATLSDRVTGHAAATPDRPAYVDFRTAAPDAVLTWAEFDDAATNLAAQLRDQGVHTGDRVAVWHGDTAAIHVLLVAVERCGAVAVGLGARAGVREVAHIVPLEVRCHTHHAAGFSGWLGALAALAGFSAGFCACAGRLRSRVALSRLS